MTINAYRIVLADDSALFRQTLKTTLSEKKDFEIVGEAGDGLELLKLLDRLALNDLDPHLVVLDLSMPILNGIAAASQIKATYPNIKVLILTMYSYSKLVNEALSKGVKGYLLKDDSEREIFWAIEMIRRGEIYLSPTLSRESETRGKVDEKEGQREPFR